MRAISITSLIFFMGLAPAYAADDILDERMNITSWTGFYVGGSIGRSNIEDTDPLTIIPGTPVHSEGDGSGAGFHIGYMKNYDGLVLGVEYEYVDLDSIQFVVVSPAVVAGLALPVYVEEAHNIRARIGAAFDDIHVYASGGFSHVTAAVTGTAPLEDWVYTVGVGIEYAASENIIVGLQYDYSWYDEFDGLPIEGSMDRISFRISYKF